MVRARTERANRLSFSRASASLRAVPPMQPLAAMMARRMARSRSVSRAWSTIVARSLIGQPSSKGGSAPGPNRGQPDPFPNCRNHMPQALSDPTARAWSSCPPRPPHDREHAGRSLSSERSAPIHRDCPRTTSWPHRWISNFHPEYCCLAIGVYGATSSTRHISQSSGLTSTPTLHAGWRFASFAFMLPPPGGHRR